MNKIGFIHIPKTGGGSIKHWFKTNEFEGEFFSYGHNFLPDLIKKYGEVDFSFTCVRNIYDKMISFYNWQGRKHLKRHNKSLKKYGTSNYTEWVDAYNKGIIEYIEYSKSLNYYMTISQVEWIKDVDYVMRLNKLDEDFKKVQEYTNCYVPLSRSKHIRSHTYDAKSYFTSDFKLAIDNIFKDEIEYFDWKPKY